MTLPLQLDDVLVDRNKSALFLYYLGRSAQKLKEKEIAKKKLEITLKQLRKLSTKEISKHLDILEKHLKETLQKERRLLTTQEKEEMFLDSLAKKIDLLQHKLTRYQKTQNLRKKRIKELEEKMKLTLASKKEKINILKEDLKRLKTLYNSVKNKKNFDKRRLKKIADRILKIKEKIDALK